MSRIKRLAKHRDRELFLAELPEVGAWDGWPKPPVPFCLIVFLNQPASVSALTDFARSALQAGACSIMAAGGAAESMEDAFDRVIVEDGLERDADDDVILTTNHKGDLVDEILWEAFFIPPIQSENTDLGVPIIAVCFGDDPARDELARLAGDLDGAFEAVEQREP